MQRLLLALASVVLAGLLLPETAQSQVTPTIHVNFLSSYGASPGYVGGQVTGVNYTAYKITAVMFVPDLGYYTKPDCGATSSFLGVDGYFSVSLGSGGLDPYFTYLSLLVVPNYVSVPCVTGAPGIPASLESQAVAQLLVPRPNPNQREIQFAGQTWIVKSAPGRVYPGPNYFSDSTDNVFVDAFGRLHLKITKRNGLWYCAEVISKGPVDYGRYMVQIESAPQFDSNVVPGFFTFAEAERDNREIDLLELGPVGHIDQFNAQNVVQPYTTPGNLMRFSLPMIAPTVHTMVWQPTVLAFQSRDAFGNLLHQWTYGATPPDAESDRLRFHINLWLANGVAPSNGNEAELVVSAFAFAPLSNGAPAVDSLSPFAGAGGTQTFTATYSSPTGWDDIAKADFLVNVVPSPSNACFVEYNSGTNALLLMADNGLTWLGPITPGSGSLRNGACTLDGAGSSVVAQGAAMTVKLRITFQPGYGGKRGIFLSATSYTGARLDWSQYGAWWPALKGGGALIPWYRLYDPSTQSHHYTSDPNEYNTLVQRGWTGEGVMGRMYDGPNGTAQALYRINIAPARTHFWTTDRNEYLSLIKNRGVYVGEGLDGFILPAAGAGTLPVYRLLYCCASSPLHHWTTDANENATLLTRGWSSEGIIGYLVAGSSNAVPAAAVSVVSTAAGTSGRFTPGEPITLLGVGLQEAEITVAGLPVTTVDRSVDRLRFVLPENLPATGSAEIVIRRGAATLHRSNVLLEAAHPGVFTAADGEGPALLENATTPLKPGDHLVLSVSGLGDTLPVRVLLGGLEAELLQRTVHNGVTHLRVRVPRAVLTGEAVPVTVYAGEFSSQGGVFVPIARPKRR